MQVPNRDYPTNSSGLEKKKKAWIYTPNVAHKQGLKVVKYTPMQSLPA